MRVGLIILILISGFFSLHSADPDALNERVAVVANGLVPDSLKLARYYMELRDIPEENLIVIEASESESVTREEYVTKIGNPIVEALVDKGLVEAMLSGKDDLGRIKATLFVTPEIYLVTTYGVPVKIQNEPELDDTELREKFFNKSPNLQSTFGGGPMAKSAASVDGELAVLFLDEPPLNGFIPNPYFKKQPDTFSSVLKVNRLDGPNYRAIRKMLKKSIEGEKRGLRGRAYVDEDTRGGGYAVGNEWMANTAKLFQSMGFDLGHNVERPTFNSDDRFDAPVLYAGWYARHVNGPFKMDRFSFPPGAVAMHLHSSSASPLRSEDKGWVGPFVQSGVSATIGNTSEPYLTFTHNMDVLFAALAQGYNFGDSAYAALPGVSWQGVAIGDPLFRPFAKSLDFQRENFKETDNDLLNQYVVLRQMNLNPEEAEMLGRSGVWKAPGPALALRLAKILAEEGKKDAALRYLGFAKLVTDIELQEKILYADIADVLIELGEKKDAFTIYETLLKSQNSLPQPMRKHLLKRGIAAAEKAGSLDSAMEWRKALTPPPEN